MAKKLTAPEFDTLNNMEGKDAKRCPNCYIVIEKFGGCNHMYCTGCRIYFHWDEAFHLIPGARPVDPASIPESSPNVVCEIDALKANVDGSNGVTGAN